MLLPNLSILDIENMDLVEIQNRIDFVSNLKKTKKKAEMKDMFSMLHFTVKSATAQVGKKSDAVKNNKTFHKALDDCFGVKKEEEDQIDNAQDFMEVMNGVKK